jgi:hypothetical protein
MLDLSHIPNSQQDVQIFNANRGNFGYQTWRKPRKCSFVYILSIDGGSGGNFGELAGVGGSASGGFGGGGGSVTRALINSGFVPDILYIKVGKGGIGGTFGSPAGTGESSGVYLLSNVSSQATLNKASSFLGGSSSADLFTGGGASILANNFFFGLTNIISLAGRNPFANGAFSPGSIDPFLSQIVTAGCPGGGFFTDAIPNAGGGFNASSISQAIPGGAPGTVGANGANGYTSWKPFFSLGGAGGGASVVAGGQGGKGGNGGIGTGGGGGGASLNGTRGNGGDGGDGIVIIISF